MTTTHKIMAVKKMLLSIVRKLSLPLVVLISTLLPQSAFAICAYYPGAYDGYSYSLLTAGSVRSGYGSWGTYGTYTCQGSGSNTYWSGDNGYVAAQTAAPEPPAATTFTVYNQTSQPASCGGSYIGPYGSGTCTAPVQIGLQPVYDYTDPRYYDTYSITHASGTAQWARAGSAGMSFQSYDVPASNTVTIAGYSQVCSMSAPVAMGCVPQTCNLPWGGTLANGSSTTAFAAYSAPFGSSCQSQTRTCSNGTLTGSYSAASCSVQAPANCGAGVVRWGTGNFCSSNATATSHSGSTLLTNTAAGAAGTSSAMCSNGSWSVSSSSCDSNLIAPAALNATDGTVQAGINVTWPASPGASSYRLQQRPKGSTTWTDLYTGTATSYNWTGLNTEEIKEFRMRSENILGQSDYGVIEEGYVMKFLNPLFVSQTGIPAKVGVGATFSFSQVWKNNGAETWTGASYGTAHHADNGAVQWSVAFTSFSGSTATNAQITSTMTATAPAVAGTYTLQRVMQKNGTSYGAPSTAATVVVYDTPKCTAVNTDLSTTFNPNGTVTATLAGASSVESATVRVWGEVKGEASGIDYPFSFNGTNWVGTFPVAPHLAPDEVKINLKASVSNSIFGSFVCASTSVVYQQLPVPAVSLTPTFGSFGDASRQGFVVNRTSGEFAKISVDLGALSGTLKARVEVLDESNSLLNVGLNAINAGQQTSVLMSSPTLSATPSSWQQVNATVRVTYADPAAAAQNKVVLVPVAWTVAPAGLSVTATGINAATPTVNASIAPSSGSFSSTVHGAFTGYVRLAPNAGTVGATQDVAADGSWIVSNLDYSQLYASQLVAVARAMPPAGINLFSPLEFVSVTFGLPVNAPRNVAATDGTREDDVQVVWPAVATGSAIRYRVFRDAAEVTPVTGIPDIEFIDVPPDRGTTYTYTVKTMINNVLSQSEAIDTGFVPACRAARLIGASLNADMTAINGLVEQWACLQGMSATTAIDSDAPSVQEIAGQRVYRSFSATVPLQLPDGAHVLHLGMTSEGVVINPNRTYDVPFQLNRAAIAVKNLTIIHNGSPAADGLETNSIGRFGIRMEGGSGIGFAEEVK